MISKVLFLALIAVAIAESTTPSTPRTTNCVYKQSTKKLSCDSTLGKAECDAKITSSAKDFKMYSIGELTAVTENNVPLEWFHLHPRKEDNSGWWYYKNTKFSDTKFSIHTPEKNTKRDEGIVVTDVLCWAKLVEIIRSSKSLETIKAEKFHTRILSRNFEKVSVIGFMNIVA